MIKTYLPIAALVIALAPNIAAAQAITGYQIPDAPRTSAQPPAAYQADLSKPGDGYRITATPRTSPQPLAAYAPDLSVPGDGYRIVSTPNHQSTASVK
jgi:hypothetical protein